jgi:signal transduction histidine kinase/CheY-like chemotaxis protein
MLGYSEGELLQLGIPDIEANESPQDVAEYIAKVIVHSHDRFDTRHRRKDGSLVEVEISVNLVDLGGEKLFYAFARDITPRKQAEASLIRARDDAERANRAKSEFLSRMSHELRTPMNAILGFAQVLELESIAPEHKDYIREIHRAGDHLLELINELLDLSRIETGKLPVLVQPIALQAILSQALQITQAMREERQIALLQYCQNEVRILADATRLRQILVNLLTNAVKYNHAGGRITIACQPQSDTMLRIAVADTGPGIVPEKQHLLFRPFERLGAELSEVEGVGIRLALSKQLAELMGAKIGVDSTPGVGSTFWLDLALAPLSMPLTSNANQPPGKKSQQKCKVLYVEDNAANLKLVEVLLRRQPDIDLITATNGEYGLELARRYQPDAILLDIHLPGMDGYALLDSLKADAATSAIPVLALSADAMPVDVARGLQAGFKRYLTKPIDGKELIAAIREVV